MVPSVAIATDEEGGEEAEQPERVGIRFNKSRVDCANQKIVKPAEVVKGWVESWNDATLVHYRINL